MESANFGNAIQVPNQKTLTEETLQYNSLIKKYSHRLIFLTLFYLGHEDITLRSKAFEVILRLLPVQFGWLEEENKIITMAMAGKIKFLKYLFILFILFVCLFHKRAI